MEFHFCVVCNRWLRPDEGKIVLDVEGKPKIICTVCEVNGGLAVIGQQDLMAPGGQGIENERTTIYS